MAIFQYYLREGPKKVIDGLRRAGIVKSSSCYTKFIIITRSRSGSTLLVDYLNSHSKIECDGEMFQMLYKPLEEQWHHVWRPASSNTDAFGFKVFYNHPQDENSEPLQQLIAADPSIKIVHLMRRNLLAVAASLYSAVSTGQYVGKKGRTKGHYVTLDPKELEDFFEWNRRLRLRTTDQFGKGRDYCEIFYEDLVEDSKKEMYRLFDFIGVVPESFLSSLRKQNTLPLSEKVVNFRELNDHFRDSDFSSYFTCHESD